MKLVYLVTTGIVTLAVLSSFSFVTFGSTNSSFSNHASLEVTSGTLWLFNGSFVNYTGIKDGSNATFHYSISDVNLSAGTYYVSTNINGHNLTIKSYTNRSSVFPGTNATGLSYLNFGKTPPWINSTIFKQFSVFTDKKLNTRLGDYPSDEVKDYIIQSLNGLTIYTNGTFCFDRNSGLILKENLSMHYEQSWQNESFEIFSTNIPLGNNTNVMGQNFTIYYIAGAVIAVVIVSGVGIFLYRRRN